jgi:hypothetical protein
LKKGSRGEYLGPRAMRMVSEEGSTMRNFIVCTFLDYGTTTLEDL